MEAHVMQRLATARYFHKREMQRYPGLNASPVIDSISAANASLTLPTYTNLPNFCHGSSHSDLLISIIRSIDIVFFKQLPPDNLRRPSPSEIFFFSEFVKSKWSAASASLKERLLSRNTSVKELSKDVECEMSVGIAGVAKMIERLDLAPKCKIYTPSSVNVRGQSNVLFNIFTVITSLGAKMDMLFVANNSLICANKGFFQLNSILVILSNNRRRRGRRRQREGLAQYQRQLL
ncbi:hypothetical protein KPL70_023013 [Citrus sinensis]|nr:hypothetical protein KPL70_023013 [Citrus sinensis]